MPWGSEETRDPIVSQDFPEEVTSGWLYHGDGAAEEVGTRPPQTERGAQKLIH